MNVTHNRDETRPDPKVKSQLEAILDYTFVSHRGEIYISPRGKTNKYHLRHRFFRKHDFIN